MMKRIIAYLFILSALWATGCNDSSLEPAPPVPHGNEIRFGLGIGVNASTRAPVESENGLPTKDLEAIQILRADGAISGFHTKPSSEIISGKITANTSDIHELSERQYFNAVHDDAHFMAFHPAGSYTPGLVSHKITGQEDILVAERATATHSLSMGMVDFTFNHQLTWVKLVVKADSPESVAAYGKLNHASITVPNQTELVINSNGTTAFRQKNGSTTAELPFLSGEQGLTTDEAAVGTGLMIFPKTEDLTHIKLGFENKGSAEYAIEGHTLSAGKQIKIIVTVKMTGISFKAKIAAWGDDQGEGGDTGIEIGLDN